VSPDLCPDLRICVGLDILYPAGYSKTMKYELRSTRQFDKWLAGLKKKDRLTWARILNRINNAAEGIFGDHKRVGDGIVELRMFFGPGYRVYFTIYLTTIILILAGGDKSSQGRDIELAKRLINDLED